MANELSPIDRRALEGMGHRLSNELQLAKTLKEWLRENLGSEQTAVVQRVLYMLDYFGFQW
jgi:hypothetical protein